MDSEERYYADPGFHAKLKRDWPEPPEALHSGGNAQTLILGDRLLSELNGSAVRILDLCCGEGWTCEYLREYLEPKGVRASMVGVDINEEAISSARRKYPKNVYVRASAYELPEDIGEFDAVIGQDPDAFANGNRRLDAFKQAFKVLKPNGLFTFHHHWIPGLDWTKEQYATYDETEKTLDLNARAYERDLIKANFAIDPCTKLEAGYVNALAESHLLKMRLNHDRRTQTEEQPIDEWLVRTTDLMLSNNRKFGYAVCARAS